MYLACRLRPKRAAAFRVALDLTTLGNGAENHMAAGHKSARSSAKRAAAICGIRVCIAAAVSRAEARRVVCAGGFASLFFSGRGGCG